jgi:hypothetical protein
MIKKLSARTAEADFQFLHPQIQQNYKNMILVYEQLEADKARQLKAMEADFIPQDGPQIKVAWYVKDPTNPARSVQATLPANAIQWLVQRLTDQQGLVTQDQKLTMGDQADIAKIYSGQQNEQQQQQQQQNQQAAVGMPTDRGFLQ